MSPIVHSARPSGVGEHAMATIVASTSPSNLAGPPDRGRSPRLASKPSAANRLRIATTVATHTPTASATSSSVSPASLPSRTWTRFRSRSVSRPQNRPRKSARWSSVN